MRSYGQYCPIARASEILAERWTVIILRNLLIGCRTFNEIADGAPGLSRGLLAKRLRDLERVGVVDIRPKRDGPGSTYEPTEAGWELWDVMLALQRWGSKWAELSPEHAHPGVVLWAWA
ncbi:MAG: helix-turn-helix transcriptional regulator, partial [Actinobacteria bacterium]|nr:helix-turn-helix transcriptional regulator [Actinomycetota bacterium]